MALVVETAKPTDIDELIALYFAIYGPKYPLSLGNDRSVMRKMMRSENTLWLVTRNTDTQLLVGSTVFETDLINKVAKLAGVAVHRDYRKQNIALAMINKGSTRLLEENGCVNSIYATTRTLSVGPQIMCLRDGFIPLGIFPNAHRIRDYETLTLMAKFKNGLLERRAPLLAVPEKVFPIASLMNKRLGFAEPVDKIPHAHVQPLEPLEFEFIFAEHYVHNRFLETFSDPYDRFYPFHVPNLIIASTNGEVEFYAYLNRPDKYCAIVAVNRPLSSLSGRLSHLLTQLDDQGASYVEALISLDRTESICALLDVQFLPSAFYPALREVDGVLCDFVVLSRTMEPLNFKGMALEKSFKPYVDQYVDLWKQMHLDTLEIFNDYE